MGASIDTAETHKQDQEQDAPHNTPLPAAVAHSLAQQDEEHAVERRRRQDMVTGKAVAGMEGRTGDEVLVRSWAGNHVLRPNLQHGNAEGIEEQEEKQPPVVALPEEDAHPYGDKDLRAARLRHGMEKRIEQGGTLFQNRSVHQLIPRKEMLMGRGQGETKKHKQEESAPKKRIRCIDGVRLALQLSSP